MNFPKRLLLLFLNVHAFPADHHFCSESPRAKVGTGPTESPQAYRGHVTILKSPTGPSTGFWVTGDTARVWALGL